MNRVDLPGKVTRLTRRMQQANSDMSPALKLFSCDKRVRRDTVVSFAFSFEICRTPVAERIVRLDEMKSKTKLVYKGQSTHACLTV